MNNFEISLAPPNSIILIADPSLRYEVPADMGSALITATPSCIGVGTLAEMDGETTIRLSEAFAAPEGRLVFDGLLETPGLQVALIDSGASPLLSMHVQSRTTRIKIWVNDPSEPDLVLVQAQG
jgi:hypothetical protein